jgi:transposase
VSDRSRWSSRRKMEVVLRLLTGEDLEALSSEFGVPAAAIAKWRDRFVVGGQGALKSRVADERDEQIRRMRAKIGKITMENELLRQRARRAETNRPFVVAEAEAVGQSISPSAGRTYGVRLACRVLELPRSSVYAARSRAALTAQIGAVPATDPWLGRDYYRKAWAWLRRATIQAGTAQYIYLAAGANVVASLALIPVAGEPTDNAVLFGTPLAWLLWHTPLFYNWKFGADLTLLSLASIGLHFVLVSAHINPVAAIHIAWKLPFVVATLGVAALLLRLGRQVGASPRIARLAALLWLVSPAVLFVGAGYGEVEPLACLCLIAGLTLLLDDRAFTAGLAFGLGAGIEYWPIAGVAFGLWLAIGHRNRISLLLRLAAGSILALLLCFGPIALTGAGRAGLLGGVASSAGASNHAIGPAYPLAIWIFGALSFGREYWLYLFVASVVGTLTAVALLAVRNPLRVRRVGIAGVSALLLEAVLINAHALAQFSVILCLAIVLAMLTRPVNPLAVLGPIFAVWTFFTYVSINDAYSDIAPKSYSAGPSLPVNDTGVRLLMMAAVLVSVLPLVLSAWSARNRFMQMSAYVAVIVSLGCCALLAGWSLQPRFWSNVLSAQPAQLQRFSSAVAFQAEHVYADGNALVVRASSALAGAIASSSVKPATVATLTVSDLELADSYGYLAKVGCSLGTSSLGSGKVKFCLPAAPSRWTDVTGLWERVFVRMPGVGSAAVRRRVSVRLAGESATVHGIVEPTSGGWYRVSFLIPRQARADRLPVLTMALGGGSSFGSKVSLLPAKGRAAFTLFGHRLRATFQINSQGAGEVFGVPLIVDGVIRPAAFGVPLAQVDRVGVMWRGRSIGGLATLGLSAGGLAFGILLLLFGTLAWRRVVHGGSWRRDHSYAVKSQGSSGQIGQKSLKGSRLAVRIRSRQRRDATR